MSEGRVIRAGYTYGEALGMLGQALRIRPEEYTRFSGRIRNLLREYPGQPHLGPGGQVGKATIFSEEDIHELLIAMQLNLAGIYPSVAIPATKQALEKISRAPVVSVDLPFVLGAGSITVTVHIPALFPVPAKRGGENWSGR